MHVLRCQHVIRVRRVYVLEHTVATAVQQSVLIIFRICEHAFGDFAQVATASVAAKINNVHQFWLC